MLATHQLCKYDSIIISYQLTDQHELTYKYELMHSFRTLLSEVVWILDFLIWKISKKSFKFWEFWKYCPSIIFKFFFAEIIFRAETWQKQMGYSKEQNAEVSARETKIYPTNNHKTFPSLKKITLYYWSFFYVIVFETDLYVKKFIQCLATMLKVNIAKMKKVFMGDPTASALKLGNTGNAIQFQFQDDMFDEFYFHYCLDKENI